MSSPSQGGQDPRPPYPPGPVTPGSVLLLGIPWVLAVARRLAANDDPAGQ